MNWNPWTLALIGAGLVSLPAAARAEEKPSPVLTALSATTISGFVDTSAHWNFGTGNANLPTYTPNGVPATSKADGFNLDVIELTISKPAGEEAWSAGYNATLLFGPDATGYNTSFFGTGGQAAISDFSLKDTYVDLHAPVGNGLDFKLGTFTEILGYEVYEAGNNPNYTRSYGYMIEPTQETGLLGSYQLTPQVLLSGGIADTWSAGVNSRAFLTTPASRAESFKTYMGSLAFTCPTNWGFLSGSTLSGGVISGWDAFNEVDKTSFYVGGTFNTPISSVKVGLAYDYVALGNNFLGAGFTPGPIGAIPGTTESSGYQNTVGGYVAYQATEKLSFNTRAEYFSQSGYLAASPAGAGLPAEALEITETAQYQLWKNVISRVELRWDHALNDQQAFGGTVTGLPTRDNAFLLAANVIYKF
jgi:hypothetical protein